MTKEHLRTQILEKLHAELELQSQAARLARDEATSEESRAQNKYDTHSQEAAYLAEGQARLASEVSESIKVYLSLPLPDFEAEAPIALGALVSTVAGKTTAWYFLGPRAGGLELTGTEGESILVTTPASPLGRQLMGKSAGDTVPSPGRPAALQTIRQVS